MKTVRVKCANCGRIESVEYGLLMSGGWQCICACDIWEIIEDGRIQQD